MIKTILITLFAVGITGCASDPFPRATNTQKGAVIGALGGAAVGAAVSKNKGKGALLGAIGGGLAGGGVGYYMDRQKQDLEKVLAPERQTGAIDIDKLPDNTLKITMTNQTAFDVNSADVKSGFHSTMDKLAQVMNKYGKTTLTIMGHTDSDGSAQYNQDLSQRRAFAVQQAFVQRSVIPERLSAIGKGESEPRASNSTESGKQLNRRVEIFVEPVVEG
ncbi:MAG TPA: OmpA family protein [Burkholderiales bacterium]|nr:OmpA family protein [Burkholderiales bacterium]